MGMYHLLFSSDFKWKKCQLKIANLAASNLWNCGGSLYDSVNYGDELNPEEGFDKATFFFY